MNIPFDTGVHLKSPFPAEESNLQVLRELRTFLQKNHSELYSQFESWLTDEELVRFLIARKYDVKKSAALLVEAMNWRNFRKPHLLESMEGVGSTNEPWHIKFSKECETGKIYVPGFDQYNRPVVIFDNTVQNTNEPDDHMLYLAWSLEFAIRQMKAVDKYVIFVHLENFSIFKCPPLKSTIETLQMLGSCYPERLGHIIAYNPPRIFSVFFNSIKSFIDPKTVGKLVFIHGDCHEGSPNDLKMKELIGPNWKILTGVDQPVYKPGCSPGYNHDQYWPTVLDRIAELQRQERKVSTIYHPAIAATEPSSEDSSAKYEQDAMTYHTMSEMKDEQLESPVKVFKSSVHSFMMIVVGLVINVYFVVRSDWMSDYRRFLFALLIISPIRIKYNWSIRQSK